MISNNNPFQFHLIRQDNGVYASPSILSGLYNPFDGMWRYQASRINRYELTNTPKGRFKLGWIEQWIEMEMRTWWLKRIGVLEAVAGEDNSSGRHVWDIYCDNCEKRYSQGQQYRNSRSCNVRLSFWWGKEGLIVSDTVHDDSSWLAYFDNDRELHLLFFGSSLNPRRRRNTQYQETAVLVNLME